MNLAAPPHLAARARVIRLEPRVIGLTHAPDKNTKITRQPLTGNQFPTFFVFCGGISTIEFLLGKTN